MVATVPISSVREHWEQSLVNNYHLFLYKHNKNNCSSYLSRVYVWNSKGICDYKIL